MRGADRPLESRSDVGGGVTVARNGGGRTDRGSVPVDLKVGDYEHSGKRTFINASKTGGEVDRILTSQSLGISCMVAPALFFTHASWPVPKRT